MRITLAHAATRVGVTGATALRVPRGRGHAPAGMRTRVGSTAPRIQGSRDLDGRDFDGRDFDGGDLDGGGLDGD